MKTHRRGLVFKIHLYAGTVLSVPLLVIVLTGIVLGFYDALRYAAAPYRLDQPAMHTLSPAALAERVRSACPDLRLSILYLPTAAQRAARAEFICAERPVLAFLDPTTGAVLAQQDRADSDWLQFLYHLHRGKPLGLAGQILASASGGLVLVLWLAGMVLWWPKRGSPRPHRAGLRPRLLGIHRWIGVWLGALLSLMAAAGALLNFAGPLGQIFNPPPTAVTPVEVFQRVPLEHLFRQATGTYPAAGLERIYFPNQDDALWQFRFADGGRVYVDGNNGHVVRSSAPSSHWTSLLYPLHSGRIAGPYGPPAIALSGVILLLAIISGLFYWRRAASREKLP